MKLDIKVDDRVLKARMNKAPKRIHNALQQGVNASAIFVQRAILKEAPVHDGDLRDSVKVRTGNLMATVGATSKYAIFVEKGTKPHYPPINAIRKWADDHNINPFALQRSIGIKGTKANPFTKRAYEKSKKGAEQLGAKIVIKRLKGL